ncbi:hypothetical protein BJG93_36330 [Paraburkholderia sprentiae WSM5005]|uniref:Uncharacterized protein n=1 Tax=Paraburkholderia sprentiae WSM5005 TaxID=754502 RepID=A0A8F4QJS9_9BURK|nr:hypothetical protein [Paraburkholderia sprentiae]QXE07276.1 hypothetical protein BJG93_36330 [Paraburkholderia sprentiae WSM5005]
MIQRFPKSLTFDWIVSQTSALARPNSHSPESPHRTGHKRIQQADRSSDRYVAIHLRSRKPSP